MTSIDDIQDISPRVQFTAAGGQTVFSFPFPFFVDGDLRIFVGDSEQTLATHYTVTGAGSDDGGEVTFLSGLTAGDLVTIFRDTAIERRTDFQFLGALPSTSINRDLDRLTIIAQEQAERSGRSVVRDVVSGKITQGIEFDGLAGITGLPTPTQSSDAATQAWVAGQVAALGSLSDVPVVGSIAALQALEPGSTAQVLGYTSPGDGGGGLFYFDAAGSDSEDGFSVINPAAGDGVWRRLVVYFDSVEGVFDSTSTVFVENQIIQTRKEGFSYKVAPNSADDEHVITAGGIKLYVVAQGGVRAIEAYGKIESANGTKELVQRALMSISDGEQLVQLTSGHILVDPVEVIHPGCTNVAISLRLKAGDNFNLFLIKLQNMNNALFDISIDHAENTGRGLRIEECLNPHVPRSAIMNNGKSSSAHMAAGVQVRNCFGGVIEPTVENFSGADGAEPLRGVIIDGNELPYNPVLVRPIVKKLIGVGSCEADGALSEGLAKGIRFIGGHYENITRRFVKAQTPDAVINDNFGYSDIGVIGRNMLTAFALQWGTGEIWHNTATIVNGGVERAISILSEGADKIKISGGHNKIRSESATESSQAIRINGDIDEVWFAGDELEGFERITSHTATTAGSELAGQSIRLHNIKFIPGGSVGNALTLVGDFAVAEILNLVIPGSPSGTFVVSAANLSNNILRLTGSFNYGNLVSPSTTLRMWEYKNVRLREQSAARRIAANDGVYTLYVDNALPSSGNFLRGDEVKRLNAVAGSNPGWVCVTSGAIGSTAVFKEMASIEA